MQKRKSQYFLLKRNFKGSSVKGVNVMKKRISALISALLCAVFVLASCSSADNTPEETTAEQTAFVSYDASAAPDMTNAVNIEFSSSSVTSSESSVTCSGSDAVITAGGVYVITGSSADGSLTVNAPDSEVWLVLKNADITCKDSSPLYVYKSKKTYIYLDSDSENKLSDSGEYSYTSEFSSQADEEPNACVYSKSDLMIYGSGSLSVSAEFNNGITSKDNLEIENSVITVNAANNGINGKDSLTANNASFNVTAGADAVRSTNDTDTEKGYITLNNCALSLVSGEDGVQAETALVINGGDYNITAGGGHSAQLGEDVSAKGIKAGGELTVTDGKFTLDCADDAVHSNGNITVSGGEFDINTGDDAFHADSTLSVSGGKINIETCYEGLEGSDVDVSDGEINIVSSDDGLNAAGGNDESGFGNNDPWQSSGNHSIKISGGTLNVIAGGDGFDSNGSMEISGGIIAVSSSTEDNGALDYDGTCTLTGGTLFAQSKGNVMAQAPSSCEQPAMFFSLSSGASKGSEVVISNGEKTFTYTLTCDASNIVFSSPELEQGETYTVTLNGESVCEITLDDMLTTYGNVSTSGQPGGGMNGQPGGDMGAGQPGGGMNGGQNGNMGGMQPPDGNNGQGR